VSRLLKKDIRKFRVVILGAGAAGIANAHMIAAYGIKDIILCDRAGTLYAGRRQDMNPYKAAIAKATNPRKVKGSLFDALKGAHIFIGLAGPNTVTTDHIRSMAKEPIVFVLANPDPEIAPEAALPLVRILATGRSDYPNQINNMLGFPGIFRGLLDARARGVNEEVKLAAAKAIAYTIKDENLHEDYIIPSCFDRKVVTNVAHAVAEAVKKTGLARK
jgi:malate dehydrogenase (oxaloacetate-decarboxylating)